MDRKWHAAKLTEETHRESKAPSMETATSSLGSESGEHWSHLHNSQRLWFHSLQLSEESSTMSHRDTCQIPTETEHSDHHQLTDKCTDNNFVNGQFSLHQHEQWLVINRIRHFKHITMSYEFQQIICKDKLWTEVVLALAMNIARSASICWRKDCNSLFSRFLRILCTTFYGLLFSLERFYCILFPYNSHLPYIHFIFSSVQFSSICSWTQGLLKRWVGFQSTPELCPLKMILLHVQSDRKRFYELQVCDCYQANVC